MNIQNLFKLMESKEGSDLHLKPGAKPIMRLHGQLVPAEEESCTAQELQDLFHSMTSPDQQEIFAADKELDFSYQTAEGSRYRVNASLQKNQLSLAMRRITDKIPSIDELGLPEICKGLALQKQGLILVTGPTGSGKSTTLASMIDHINQNKASRIITVEDPIEYLYRDKASFITQRELGQDTKSFARAATQALRQDPDVILVGEMRDPETMAACITAAETGHLVMSTLHTNNAPQSIDRILDSFPPHQQNQIRMQLSLSLLAVIAQRLVPRQDQIGRVAVIEIMLANNAIRNLIREGKTHQMLTVMQTGSELGMKTMDQSLQEMSKQGLISPEEAASLDSSSRFRN